MNQRVCRKVLHQDPHWQQEAASCKDLDNLESLDWWGSFQKNPRGCFLWNINTWKPHCVCWSEVDYIFNIGEKKTLTVIGAWCLRQKGIAIRKSPRRYTFAVENYSTGQANNFGHTDEESLVSLSKVGTLLFPGEASHYITHPEFIGDYLGQLEVMDTPLNVVISLRTPPW